MDQTAYERIRYEPDGPIARVVLNRPEKRNALDERTVDELKRAIRAAGDDPDVRVVLLSSGGADFCSGADLSALRKIAESSVLENRDDARSMMELFLLMRRLPKPIVAAVRGRALAGGAGLATACDAIVASENAQFGYPEVKIGFVPAMVMAMLRRCVSEKVAFDLIARGEPISAARAREVGLVTEVAPDDGLDAAADAYARALARSSASAISLSKYLIYHIDGMSFDAAISSGADLNAIARLTGDCQAGIARFLDREAK